MICVYTREYLIPAPRFIFLVLLSLLCEASLHSQPGKYFTTISRRGTKCIIDTNNQELIPSGKYSGIWTAYDPDNKLFVVTGPDYKKGLYRLGEKELLPCEFDQINLFNSDYGYVMKNGKWALMNRQFQPVTAYSFDEVAPFYGSKSLVKKDNRYIIIDTTGKIIKKLSFDFTIFFGTSDKYRKAGLEHKFGYTDRDGNIIIPMQYEDVADAVYNDLFPVKKNGKWGYVNKKNEVVVPIVYEYVTPVYQGIGLLKANTRMIAAINEKGRFIFNDRKYQNIEYAREGKYSILQNGLWGYIDSVSYKEIITPRFLSCASFYNHVAIVGTRESANLIDTLGNLLLPPTYHYLANWGTILFAAKSVKFGAINKDGDILLPFEYDKIAYSGQGAVIEKNKLKGIMSQDRSVFIAPAYDSIIDISDRFFFVKKGARSFIVNKEGKETPAD